jgi:hypothetical protein
MVLTASPCLWRDAFVKGGSKGSAVPMRKIAGAIDRGDIDDGFGLDRIGAWLSGSGDKESSPLASSTDLGRRLSVVVYCTTSASVTRSD